MFAIRPVSVIALTWLTVTCTAVWTAVEIEQRSYGWINYQDYISAVAAVAAIRST
jgi:hypothetical protein